ncbi:hypothetical protein SAMN02927923_01869 [Microvirga guangxiensis]|uniref:Uncharacterized protein n=1 Tax=Microvirga guangxiensis TaxID=549386 RepID=A0A1G5HQX2_9HYPH|nr:hypothetical protein SAMN02927923_01869 [Microvirga guangxiensis]
MTGTAVISKENEKHLNRILYRETFERRSEYAGQRPVPPEQDLRTVPDALAKWLRLRERIVETLPGINRKLSAINVELHISPIKPHAYTVRDYPSVGRLRIDLARDFAPTTRILEMDVNEYGLIHLYMYLPKETRRLDIGIDEVDQDRLEALLLDFVDLATQDD